MRTILFSCSKCEQLGAMLCLAERHSVGVESFMKDRRTSSSTACGKSRGNDSRPPVMCRHAWKGGKEGRLDLLELLCGDMRERLLHHTHEAKAKDAVDIPGPFFPASRRST
mmetsp:Transcript_29522/g.79306  ORF Transcript_29522/g.79306 Transcript_29522/m.79306 type:complete len:111 (-) Transcript_29522:101-433(-)